MTGFGERNGAVPRRPTAPCGSWASATNCPPPRVGTSRRGPRTSMNFSTISVPESGSRIDEVTFFLFLLWSNSAPATLKGLCRTSWVERNASDWMALFHSTILKSCHCYDCTFSHIKRIDCSADLELGSNSSQNHDIRVLLLEFFQGSKH